MVGRKNFVFLQHNGIETAIVEKKLIFS